MQSEGNTDSGLDTLQFKADTDTFSIVVEFCNSKVSIELKDYVNWIIYSKQYTEEDIGKQIHRKIDLIDIYKAFALTELNNQANNNALIRYKMGTVIKGKGLPCYKIQSKGVITTYRNVFERSSNEKSDENLQQLTYNSVLQLNKVREMEKMEQFSITSDLHRKQLTQNFVDKMVKIEEQKKSLQIKCDNLQNKLAHLEQQHRENWLKCKNEQIQQKSYLQKQIKQFAQKHDVLQGKLIHSLQQFKDSLKNLKTEQIQQTKKREQEIKSLYDVIAQSKKQQVIYKAQSQLALSLVQYSKYFKVSGPNFNLEYIGGDGTWQQLLINHPIPQNIIYTFRVKLVKAASKNIMVGVADLNKVKLSPHSHGTENAVVYYCNNGYRYPNMQAEGAVAEGETLSVVINLQEANIKIMVGEETRATLKHDMLAQSGRVFVPCIEMYNTGDIVQWIL